MSPRYLRPWRRPKDSASAPMLAAIQKCPSGRFGSSDDRRASRGDASFEQRLAFVFGRVAAEPVARARELPRGLEVLRVLLCSRRLPRSSAACRGAREVVAPRVQRHRAASGHRAGLSRRLRGPQGRALARSARYNTRMQDIIRQLLAGLGEDPSRGPARHAEARREVAAVPDERLRRRHRRGAQQRVVHRRL